MRLFLSFSFFPPAKCLANDNDLAFQDFSNLIVEGFKKIKNSSLDFENQLFEIIIIIIILRTLKFCPKLNILTFKHLPNDNALAFQGFLTQCVRVYEIGNVNLDFENINKLLILASLKLGPTFDEDSFPKCLPYDSALAFQS